MEHNQSFREHPTRRRHMRRCSRYAPALALASAACAALLAVAPSAAASSAVTIPAAPVPVLTALAFPAPATGWVLGQAATGAQAEIWHTGTAGATWHVQWEGAGSPLSITAADPAHAWALIACSGRPPSCGRELLATADGGRHWRVVATLPQAVNQVEFASDRLGVATADSCLADLALSRCPGQVLLSKDGGASWTPVLAAAAPVFATANAAGQLWAARTSSSRITILTSTDGGHSWQRTGQLSLPQPTIPLTPEVRVTLAATPSGLTWASVFDPLSCAMHGCAVAGLLHSGDGGRSWSPVALAEGYPDECASDGVALSVATDGSAWAATGRNGAACAPPFGLLYRYPAPYPATGWQQLPPWQLAQVSALAAVSGRQAYAISDRGTLSVTFDGGALWTQLLPAAAPVGQVDAITSTTALAAQDPAGAGAVLRSDDGGQSWRQVAQLPGVLTQLDFWSAAGGVAATYTPDAASPWQLFASSDGGSSWTPYGPLPGGNTDIDGPWMSADGHGLLLTVTGGTPWQPGSGGLAPVRVWTTSDYGRSWTRGGLLPLGRDTLDGPASFAPYPGPVPGGAARWSGWLVIATASYAQRVAVTNGGPLSLLPATVPSGAVQLIRPGTSGVGLAWSLDYPGGPSAAILSLARTTDNGRSWQRSSVRLSIPADSPAMPLLSFSDADHGWLVLGGGTWHTADGGRTWTGGG
jgi:photosystem II stability/assembly factor-like uncharacterized protein